MAQNCDLDSSLSISGLIIGTKFAKVILMAIEVRLSIQPFEGFPVSTQQRPPPRQDEDTAHKARGDNQKSGLSLEGNWCFIRAF
mmetsp:Transcript_11545/g.20447  ORF Transcript_11545/g.20447 Transcript_11545/m.20447 type:complete len:84 (+) Transcript_11545:1516-1767(+)